MPDAAAGCYIRYFNPRSPRGGATRVDNRDCGSARNFNPRSPRGGATERVIRGSNNFGISIHAPHEGERPQRSVTVSFATNEFQSTLPTRGSDSIADCLSQPGRRISIHAPHEGERLYHGTCKYTIFFYFNPRSPRGGATIWAANALWQLKYFNPRSPRGGATPMQTESLLHASISIHAPHEGERRIAESTLISRVKFQSTLPTRGSDGRENQVTGKLNDFNPRSPRGGATKP